MIDIKTIWKQFETFSYVKVVEELAKKPYCLGIRESQVYPNLYLIHQTPESDNSEDIVKICNGLIVEKETNKLICCTFPKCDEGSENLGSTFSNEIIIQKCIEGSLIRVYNYNDQWLFSTKRSIDAEHSKWLSQKSFKELFLDIVPMEVVEGLDKGYAYSFIICHPENAVVVPVEKPIAYLICKRNVETFEESDLVLNICHEKIKLIPNENIEYYSNKENLFDQLKKKFNGVIDSQGFIISDSLYNRQKIVNPKYDEIRGLWGNTKNRLFRFLELRQSTATENNLLEKYVKAFPNDISIFGSYEMKLSELAELVHKFYYAKFIKKETVETPYYLRKIIYKVHKAFLMDRTETKLEKIKILLFSEDIPLVYKALNCMMEEQSKCVSSGHN